MSDETNVALQQVDSRRRGFLTKLLAGGATLAALPAMSTVALGDETPENGGKGKGGKGKGGPTGKGKGEAGGQGKGTGGRMDPKRMAAQMLAKYDKDGDKALNEEELVAALTALAAQRGAGRGGQSGKGKGGAGRGGSQGKGKGGVGGKGKGNQ